MSDNTPDQLGKKSVEETTNTAPSVKRSKRQRGRIFFEIQLQTTEAKDLFSGSHSPGAIDLLSFGKKMTSIWDAAKQDDPYADWMLLKVYDALIQLRNELNSDIKHYQDAIHKLYGREALAYTAFVSDAPLIRSLWFKTQYAYLAAGIVSAFDLLMRTVFTAHRVGVLLEKSQETLNNEWLRKIENCFKLPFKWSSFKLRRTDVQAGNELAQSAQAMLGKIPAAILTKTLRAPFAPEIQGLTSNQIKMDIHNSS
jgi:integrating conjugative element protein (TIGR03761 family)